MAFFSYMQSGDHFAHFACLLLFIVKKKNVATTTTTVLKLFGKSKRVLPTDAQWAQMPKKVSFNNFGKFQDTPKTNS